MGLWLCLSYLSALVDLCSEEHYCYSTEAPFAGSSPVSHEETGPSEANLFAGKCIVDQNKFQCKQVNPLGCAYRRLKFRLAPDCGSHGSASIEAEKVWRSFCSTLKIRIS